MDEARAGRTVTVNTHQPVSLSVPTVTVLMATYNGVNYLTEQVESILNQVDVNVHLVVSDDRSSDGTWERLVDWAVDDPRILLLPQINPSGGFAANFYRLLCEAPLVDLVAFSDQDDIWNTSKLAHQAAALRAAGCDGISSNVTAVAANGGRTLIRKSYPQRRLDYLFEAPGPGSTFVFTHRLADTLRALLTDHNTPARAVQRHDWLTYAVCRARGWRWRIEDTPWVDYRQHETNALGANRGLHPALERFQQLRNGTYRSEVLKIAGTVEPIATSSECAAVAHVEKLLHDRSIRSRRQLLAYIPEARRRPRDRCILATLVAAGLI
jgi:rhamnosyltransferase